MSSQADARILGIAHKVREFLSQNVFAREGCSVRSEGHCFVAAHVLAHALNDEFRTTLWVAVEGVYSEQKVREDVLLGRLGTWSEIEDAGQMHGWAVRTGPQSLVADVTADQFGLNEVLVMDSAQAQSKGWFVRYQPDRSPPDGLDQHTAGWANWLAEQPQL